MGRFAGKKILITGGSAGIGLATARRALGAGANVCIASRSRDRLEAAAKELTAAGGAEPHPVKMDVRDEASVEHGVAAARERLGGLDIVISNAGYAHPGHVGELPMQAFEDMLAVNYLDGAGDPCRAAGTRPGGFRPHHLRLVDARVHGPVRLHRLRREQARHRWIRRMPAAGDAAARDQGFGLLPAHHRHSRPGS